MNETQRSANVWHSPANRKIPSCLSVLQFARNEIAILLIRGNWQIAFRANVAQKLRSEESSGHGRKWSVDNEDEKKEKEREREKRNWGQVEKGRRTATVENLRASSWIGRNVVRSPRFSDSRTRAYSGFISLRAGSKSSAKIYFYSPPWSVAAYISASVSRRTRSRSVKRKERCLGVLACFEISWRRRGAVVVCWQRTSFNPRQRFVKGFTFVVNHSFSRDSRDTTLLLLLSLSRTRKMCNRATNSELKILIPSRV